MAQTETVSVPLGFVERLRRTLDMIKFEHSIFAMPFALTGALLAWRTLNFNVETPALKFLYIVLAMPT